MADCLSRVKQTGIQKVMHCLSVLVMESKDDGTQRLSPLLTVEEVRQAQEECPAVSPVLAALNRNHSDSMTDMRKDVMHVNGTGAERILRVPGYKRHKFPSHLCLKSKFILWDSFNIPFRRNSDMSWQSRMC